MDTLRLHVSMASRDSMGPFGTFVAATEGCRIPSGESFSYTEKVRVMEIPGHISVGILNLKQRPLTFHELERHVQTPELLVALKGDVVFAVAPAGQPGQLPSKDAVIVLHLCQGEGVVLNKGVWHGLPFPLGPEANLSVVFQIDTPARDFELYDFGKQGFAFEIVV